MLGFKHICTLTVQEHDKMIGYVSQLCHAIAVSLMCANDNTSLCEYTGDSFRDLTRIARINDKMWAELFLWNKENLIAEIDQFDAALVPAAERAGGRRPGQTGRDVPPVHPAPRRVRQKGSVTLSVTASRCQPFSFRHLRATSPGRGSLSYQGSPLAGRESLLKTHGFILL